MSRNFCHRRFCLRIFWHRFHGVESKERVVAALFDAAEDLGANLTKAAFAAEDKTENALHKFRRRAKKGTITDKYAAGLAESITPPVSVFDLWRKAVDLAEAQALRPDRSGLDDDEALDGSP